MTGADVLTSNDRCDRCGAQAFVEVQLSAGSLLFCAHHYRELEVPLSAVTTGVTDERTRLLVTS